MTIAIIAVGYVYNDAQERHIKRDKADDVVAVADLKANQIETWRKERLNDAAFIFRSQQIASEVRDIVAHPARVFETPDWLSSMYLNHQYASMRLLAPTGEVLCTLPEERAAVPLPADVMELVRQAAKERKVLLSGLSRRENRSARIRLIVPLFVARQKDSVLAGTVVMGIDPERFLYPLLKQWPTASSTAEVLMVAREQDSVVFLSPLRHWSGQWSSLRFPVNVPTLPAAMAVHGVEGIVEGRDYRGVPVLAALRHVRESEWFVVAKIDTDEVRAPLRERGLLIVILAAALIFATAVAMLGFWRNRTASLYKKQYEAEVSRKALAAHYNYLTKYANDIILLMDDKGNVLDANERAENLYGYDREELLQLNLRDLTTATDASIEETWNDSADGAGTIFESIHRKNDGSLFPVEVSARAIDVDGTWFHQGIIRDITVRKQHEIQIARLNRIYAVLSDVNQTIVRTRNRDTLFREVCSILVKRGSFLLAWVGTVDTESRKVVVNAFDGVEDGYLQGIHVSIDDNEHGRGPVGSAVRSRRPSIFNDAATDPGFRPWRAAALQRGYRSVAAFPLLRGEEPLGVLALYAPEPGFFNQEEVVLLEEIAEDIAFALRSIEQENQRQQAESALRESEGKYKYLFESNPLPMWVYDTETLGFLAVNDAACSHYGYSRREFLRMSIRDIRPEEYIPALLESVRNSPPLERSGTWKHRKSDGTVIDMEITSHAIEFEGKNGRLVLANDVTERLHGERELRASEARFRAVYENAGTGIVLVDAEGHPMESNLAFQSLLGYSNAELRLKKITDVIHADDVESQKELRGELADGIRTVAQTEERFIRKDGQMIWGSTTISVVRSADGHPQFSVGMIRDITDRKQAEETLARTEERFSKAFHASPMPTAIGRLSDGRFLDANDAFLRMTGFRWDDVIGRNGAEIKLWSDPRQRSRVFELLKARRSLRAEEVQLQTSDGQLLEILASFEIVDLSGEACILGMFEDITERKRSELALLESERRYRELADLLPQAVYETDAKGNLTFANRKAFEFFGYAEADFRQGLNVQLMLAPEDRERAARNIGRILSGDTSLSGLEYMALRKDGSTFPAAILAVTLLRNGATVGLRGVIMDITERRDAEEQLRKFQRAVEQSPVSIVVTDADGKIEYVNPKFEKISGYSFEEVRAKNPRILKSGETSVEAYTAMWKTLTAGNEWQGEFHNKRKDGSLYWESASISPIRNAKGETTHYVAIKEDITSRKQVEEGMRQMQKMESIGTLAGGIAHDFNNILGIILGHSSLLRRTADDSQKREKNISSIESAVHRGAGLVRQILTFARKTDIAFEQVNVNDMIAELERMLEETFPKTILFGTQFDHSLCVIEADKTQLHQTLLNLCVNARDAMPEGGTITIRTSIVEGSTLRKQFPQAAKPTYASVSVSDSGTGMDEATQQRIFEPFFTTKDKGKGTGLGLSVVYGIMQSHRGFIGLESELGKGATFTLYFPLPATEMQAAGNHRIAPGEIAGGHETILLVEDEEMLRELARALLEAQGYKVILASDGKEALERYKEARDQISLVVSDIGLPKLSGDGVFHKIKAMDPGVRVILATGYIEPGMKSELFRAGVLEIVQKPYDPKDLLKKIRDTLDRRGHDAAALPPQIMTS